MLTFPQHDVLRDDQDWVSPREMERYVAVQQRYLKSEPRMFFYVAGGALLETAFTAALTVIAISLGWSSLALIVASLSAQIYIVYLLIDLPMTLYRGHPYGDTSGLWFIARGPAVLLTVLLLAARGLLVWYALA